MGIGYNPRIVTDGLVLCLDAANKKSYPGSGTTWTDLSGRGNNGTLTNGPAFNSNNGGFLTFDGTNDYILIPDNQSLTNTTSITINAWFRLANISGGGYHSILGKGTGDSDEEYCLLIMSTSLYFDVGNASGPYIQPPYNFQNNVWYNVSCVHQRTNGISTLTSYVNTVPLITQTSSAATPPIDNASPVTIGSRFHSTITGPFNGNIASVQLYTRSLSETEIQQNFNATRGRYGI